MKMFENLPREKQPGPSYGLNEIIGKDPIHLIISGEMKKMNEQDIYNTFLKSYQKVLFSIFSEGNYELLNIIISDKDILRPFVNAVSNAYRPDMVTMMYFTRLTYDYLNSKNVEKNEEIKGMLIQSCRTLYRVPIARLINFVPEATAVELCIARWGHDNEQKNIRRLNSTILSTPDITTQKVVDIYGTLFNRMTFLFIGTMFDIRDTSTNAYQSQVDSMISNAILYILDNMTMDNIKKVLMRYSEELKITRNKPRMSLHSISFDEFPRVSGAVKELESIGKYVY